MTTTSAFGVLSTLSFPFDPKTGREKHGVSIKLPEDELFFVRQISGGNATSGIRAVIQFAMAKKAEADKR